MSSTLNEPSNYNTAVQAFGPMAASIDYMIDAAQRTVLFWDVLCKRGNQYREQAADDAAHVLSYPNAIITSRLKKNVGTIAFSSRKRPRRSLKVWARQNVRWSASTRSSEQL
jgi:Protein of unknown function (DUF3141)